MRKKPDLRFCFHTQEPKISKIEIFDSSSFSYKIIGSKDLNDTVVDFLESYFTKENYSLPLKDDFSPFGKKVYDALLEVPFGSVCTYKELAEKIDCPKGYRAVGNCLNKNPFPLAIPCHRVISTNGNIGGFAFGERVKTKLLAFERLL